MLFQSGIEFEELWTYLRMNRLNNFLAWNNIMPSFYCFMYADYVMGSSHNMNLDLMDLEYQLNKHFEVEVEDTENILNLTNEYLEAAGEMFIYFSVCPKFMYEWGHFYIDLIESSSPDIIVQTLNRILVAAKEKEDKSVIHIVKRIFLKISQRFKFKYKEIGEISMSHKTSNIVNHFELGQGIQYDFTISSSFISLDTFRCRCSTICKQPSCAYYKQQRTNITFSIYSIL